MYEYKKQKGKTKEYIKTIIIVILLAIISVLLYNMYINIDISNYETSEYKSSKIQQTANVEETTTQDVTNVIEKASESVVGISKLQDNGSSIFLKNSTSELAIGTGIIISEDGYILLNR